MVIPLAPVASDTPSKVILDSGIQGDYVGSFFNIPEDFGLGRVKVLVLLGTLKS